MRQFISSVLQRTSLQMKTWLHRYLLHGLIQKVLLLFVLLFFSFAVVTITPIEVESANPPSIITYQGKLLEGGASATTTKEMGFFLFDASTGGTLLYTASGTLGSTSTVSVSPTSGIFSIDLGGSGTNSLNPAVFNASNIYLEIWIDGTKLSPRKQLTAVPYAINSRFLSGVGATSTASTSPYIPISGSDGSFDFNTTTISFLFGTTVSTTDLIVGNSITLGGETRTSWPSGGGSAFWTSSSGRMYPTTISDIVLIGTDTTTTNDILQVSGNSYVSGTSTVVGSAYFLDGNIRFANGAYPIFGGSTEYTSAIIGNPLDNPGNLVIFGSGEAPPFFAMVDGDGEGVSYIAATSTFVNNATQFILGNHSASNSGVSGVFGIMDGGSINTPSVLLTGSSTVDSYMLGNVLFGATTSTAVSSPGFAMTGDDVYVEDMLGVGNQMFVENDLYIGSSSTLRLYSTVFGSRISNFSVGGLLFDSGEGLLSFNSSNTSSVYFGPGDVFFDTNALFVDASQNYIGINTTTPAYQLTVAGTANITGDTSIGQTLYIDQSEGAVGINVSNPTRTLTVSGTAQFTGDIYGSFNVRGNIENPELIETIATTDPNAEFVRVHDDKLFVTTLGMLEIYSLFNPDLPTLLTTTSFSMEVRDIEFIGDYVYLLGSDGSLYIYDISNVGSITLVHSESITSSNVQQGSISINDENRLYLSWIDQYTTPTDGAFSIYSLESLTDPVLVTSSPGLVRDIVAYQDGAIYLEGTKFVYAQDTGNSLTPISTTVITNGRNLTLVEDKLRVATTATLKEYDVSNPDSFSESWTVTSSQVWSTHAIGDYIVNLLPIVPQVNIYKTTTTSVAFIKTLSAANPTLHATSYKGRLYITENVVGLKVYNIDGVETNLLNTGEIDTSRLRVRSNADFRQNISIQGGLNIAGGILSNGSITLQSVNTSTIQASKQLLFTSFASTSDSNIYIFDSANTIVSTSNYLSIRNGGVSLLDLSADGDIDINGSVTIDMSSTTAPTTIGVCKSGADGVYEQLELVECSSTPSDIAEFYESTPDVEVGDIIMLTDETITYIEELYDPITGLPRHNTVLDEENGTVTRGDQLRKESTIAVVTKADRTRGRAFGVVSTNPYQVLGRAVIDVAEHPQPIAIMGRVPTKVSLENGEIHPGDFITLSSVPGVGMKAGTADPVVGIALESYTGAANNKIMIAISDASQGIMESIQDLEQQLSEVYTSLALNNPATVTINYNANNNTVGYSGGNLQLNGNSIFGVSTIVSEGATWRISADGLFVSTVVTESGSKDLYTLQSESQEIVISGSSELQAGSQRITFDDVYQDIIDPYRAIKITVTLTDEANGVFVTDKSINGFTVRELQSGSSDATFDWVAIVYRKMNSTSSNSEAQPLPTTQVEPPSIEGNQNEETEENTDTDMSSSTEAAPTESEQINTNTTTISDDIEPEPIETPTTNEEDVTIQDEEEIVPDVVIDEAADQDDETTLAE